MVPGVEQSQQVHFLPVAQLGLLVLQAPLVPARFVIYVDGAPHVAYTAQMTRVPNAQATFEVTLTTAAGPLVVDLVGDAFTYAIAPGKSPWDGSLCHPVTYSGPLAP